MTPRCAQWVAWTARVVCHWWGQVEHWLWQFDDVRPGLVHQEIWHCVLGESAIHLIAFVVEDRAEPAPTCMPFRSAGHTPQLCPWTAACSLVAPHASPTHVKVLHTVVGQMIPPLAFQTTGGLLLALFGVNSFLADQQAVGEDLVGDFGGGGDKDDVTACLLTGPSVWGLDPACSQQGARR